MSIAKVQGLTSQRASLSSGRHTCTLDVDQVRRNYLLFIPRSYDRNRPSPLVVAFHGRFGTARLMETMTKFSELADHQGFVVVYPESIRGGFNLGNGLDGSQANGADDLGFVSTLIDKISENVNIDQRRVYATGMSNGAMFVYRLACELSSKFAAIAAVSGTLDAATAKRCTPARPIPVLHIHGSEDRIVPWNGLESGSRPKLLSVSDTIARWIELDKCSTEAQVTLRQGNVTCRTYGGGEGGSEVILCRVEGGGHAWPGSSQLAIFRPFLGRATKDVSATELIWDFFVRHPM